MDKHFDVNGPATITKRGFHWRDREQYEKFKGTSIPTWVNVLVKAPGGRDYGAATDTDGTFNGAVVECYGSGLKPIPQSLENVRQLHRIHVREQKDNVWVIVAYRQKPPARKPATKRPVWRQPMAKPVDGTQVHLALEDWVFDAQYVSTKFQMPSTPGKATHLFIADPAKGGSGAMVWAQADGSDHKAAGLKRADGHGIVRFHGERVHLNATCTWRLAGVRKRRKRVGADWSAKLVDFAAVEERVVGQLEGTTVTGRVVRAHPALAAPYDDVAPPVGIMPRSVWEQVRRDALVAAIKRYLDAGLPVPDAWINEYNEGKRDA